PARLFSSRFSVATSLSPRDLLSFPTRRSSDLSFTPFFTAEEREHAGVQHRLFFAQVEFCDNLIFRRRAAVDAQIVTEFYLCEKRSEEHTSELQSHLNIVCRLLLEKKKQKLQNI